MTNSQRHSKTGQLVLECRVLFVVKDERRGKISGDLVKCTASIGNQLGISWSVMMVEQLDRDLFLMEASWQVSLSNLIRFTGLPCLAGTGKWILMPSRSSLPVFLVRLKRSFNSDRKAAFCFEYLLHISSRLFNEHPRDDQKVFWWSKGKKFLGAPMRLHYFWSPAQSEGGTMIIRSWRLFLDFGCGDSNKKGKHRHSNHKQSHILIIVGWGGHEDVASLLEKGISCLRPGQRKKNIDKDAPMGDEVQDLITVLPFVRDDSFGYAVPEEQEIWDYFEGA